MVERLAWSIAVHGGAKRIAPEEEEAHTLGCLRAADAGERVLREGGSAVEAVVAAILVLEDDPTFNAGTGAVLNSDGHAECDAAIMDGSTRDVGAVAALEGARNPIAVAASLLRRKEVLLVAQGATRYARSIEAEPARNTGGRAPAKEGDTVGCVAMDTEGHFAAGTSTGGLEGTPPGRVGDSPLPGCGFAAEDPIGAVALSGDGEGIARTMLAAKALWSLAATGPDSVAEAMLRELESVDGEAGLVVMDANGTVGWSHNTPEFAVAFSDSSQPAARAFVRRTNRARPEKQTTI